MRAHGTIRAIARLLDSDRVLVRAPSWLGDFVLAEPIVRALHERLADGRLRGLSLAAPAKLLELLDGRFEGAARLALRRGEERPELYRGHELALLLNGSWRSAWCALRAGVRERVSWSSGLRAPLLTFAARPALERGRVPPGLGRAGRWPRRLPRPFGSAAFELATSIGLEVRERRPVLHVAAPARAAMSARLEAIGLHGEVPFALANLARRPRSSKGLDAESWTPILRELAASTGLPVLCVAAPGEDAELAPAVERAAHALVRALPAPHPTLSELCALIERAACLVTADSGPRHLATALARPAVVLFGPTDPRHTAEHQEQQRGLRIELPCSPCHRERCPVPGELERACLRRIPATDVARAVGELLARG